MTGESGPFRRRRRSASRRENHSENDADQSEGTHSSWLSRLQGKSSDLSISNLDDIVRVLYSPTRSSSLGVVRALFGLMMVIDIPDERGLANIDVRFGDPLQCHFPLFDWLTPLPLEYMGLLYFIMWLGSLGICLGYRFKLSCLMFIIPYWYVYLLDKSFWNNHSYLYGLVSILFAVTSANYSFSLDAVLDPSIRDKPVPMWNYGIIRFQFFLLYFYAGVKKFDPDWIGGYSMTKLGLHWVFEPFRLVLDNDQIDFWIIHIFGFLFDLTVGFFLLVDRTRPVAILFSTAFHLMNSCMFHIGQFPYVCLVTTPIFCSYDWPDQLSSLFRLSVKSDSGSVTASKCRKNLAGPTPRERYTCLAMTAYVSFQLFLPYSHFLTQGYNNWTNGLYGYSWDMMVQNWDSNVIVVKVVENNSKEEFFLDPMAWVGNTRYSKHGDMLVQYAKCLKRNLNSPEVIKSKGVPVKPFDDISIYIDVWCSLNGRFQQRMFNPEQNLLTAEWSPFSRITWLMPLLSDLSSWRDELQSLQRDVHSWSNRSDVLFVADFPGLYLENYIGHEFTNITVTVLRGVVILEQVHATERSKLVNVTLRKGDFSRVEEGEFHKIYTISQEPSCYMYTYNNHSAEKSDDRGKDAANPDAVILHKIFIENARGRIRNFFQSLRRLWDCFNKILFNVSIPVRKERTLY